MPGWGERNVKEYEKRRRELRQQLLIKYPNIGPRKLDIVLRRKLG